VKGAHQLYLAELWKFRTGFRDVQGMRKKNEQVSPKKTRQKWHIDNVIELSRIGVRMRLKLLRKLQAREKNTGLNKTRDSRGKESTTGLEKRVPGRWKSGTAPKLPQLSQQQPLVQPQQQFLSLLPLAAHSYYTP
jgi:hypothetical protein